MASSKKVNALQKERQAELKKKYFKTMGDLCTQLLGENVLLLLPPQFKENLYVSRFRDFRFEFHTHHLMDERLLKNVRINMHTFYHKTLTEYGPTKCLLTQEQSDMYLTPFKSFIGGITPESFAQAPLFIEKTKSLEHIVPSIEAHIDHVFNVMTLACNYLHNLSHYYVRGTLTYEELPPVKNFTPVRIFYQFEWIKPQAYKFKIDGNVRSAVQLLNVYQQPDLPPITVTAAQLGINTPFNNIPLNVFIQQHALIRLHERLDVLPLYFKCMALSLSFLNLKTCTDSHGNTLIELRFENIKLGYMPVDIVDGHLLIRTFLLFTQNSTPEGEKLKKISGFEKHDISYLHLDRISSFINLDFSENSRLVKLVKQCGLGEFVEMQQRLKAYVWGNCNQNIASEVEKYLSPLLADNQQGDAPNVTLDEATCPSIEPECV